MTQFNFHRFLNTLVWQIANRRNVYVKAAGTGLIAILVCFLFNLLTRNSNAGYASTIATVSVFVLGGYLFTCGAFIASDLTDKQSRISSFMLPASKLEKFISRYVCIVVVVPLATLIGLAAGDLVQVVANQLIFHDSTSVVVLFFRQFGDISLMPSDAVPSVFTNITAYLLINSIYLLLGSLFRRHAWIKSNILLITLGAVLSIAIAFGSIALLNAIYGEGNYSVVLIDSPWATVAEYVVAWAVVCFNFWLSFRIYSRMQAINNKWYNL